MPFLKFWRHFHLRRGHGRVPPCILEMSQCSVSFTNDFLPNPCLNNMISTYRKDFPWKKWLKFAKICTNHHILLLVIVGNQKYKNIFPIFILVYVAKFGYIEMMATFATRLEKETMSQPMGPWPFLKQNHEPTHIPQEKNIGARRILHLFKNY